MIKEVIRKVLKIGLGHVFSAYAINKIIAFLTNMLIVRFMSKSEYGLFCSAFNIYTIFNIFTGLGMLSSELLFCTEARNIDEKKAIYKYTLVCGFLVDIAFGALMALYGLLDLASIKESSLLIVLFSGLLAIEYIMQYLLVYYRTKLDNKRFSYLSTINSASYLVFGSIGALWSGAIGTIIGRYFAMIITIIIGLLFLKGDFTDFINNKKIHISLKKEIWVYSIKMGVSSFLNQVIYLIDVALISFIIANSEIVASYKLATLIPEGLSFVPQAIIVTFIPYYVKNQKDNAWLKSNTKKLICSLAIINLLITILLLLFAPVIIQIIGGRQYSDSVYYFRVLSISYFFLSTFRLLSTNILAIFRKTSFNLIMAGITGVTNIILDIVLINKFQAMGAAWATVISVVVASALSFPYLLRLIYFKD